MKKFIAMGVVLSTLLSSGCYYYGPCINGSGPLTTEVRDIEGFTGIVNSADFDVYVSLADNFSVEVVAHENLIPHIETYLTGSTLVVQTKNNTCYKSGAPVEVYISLPEVEFLELNGSGKLLADVANGEAFEGSNNGSGYVGIDTIYSRGLILANNGSGAIDVKGIYGQDIKFVQTGSGSISGGKVYDSENISIRHSSSGAVRAYVTNGLNLDAVMSGSGQVDLTGEVAKVDYTLNSSGRIDAIELMAYDARTTSTGSGKIFVWATDFLEATISGSGDILYRGDPKISFRITGSGSIRPY